MTKRYQNDNFFNIWENKMFVKKSLIILISGFILFSCGGGGNNNYGGGTGCVAAAANLCVKVVNSKYSIDNGDGNGFVQQKSLSLVAGSTYTFDLSDSSNASHPFNIGTSSEGGAYTTGFTSNGTQGSASATKVFTPASGASGSPASLYYYCSSHSGMGGSISVSGGQSPSDRIPEKIPVVE